MRATARFLSSIAVAGLLQACQPKFAESLEGFDRQLFQKRVGLEKGIMVSCFKCSWIDPLLGALAAQKVSIAVAGDSLCLKRYKGHFVHVSQSLIDSIYERNYNAILFRKKHGDYEFLLLKTEDAGRFEKIGTAFFSAH